MTSPTGKLQKTILIYGLPGMQMLTLASAAQKLGIRCKAVFDNQTTLTVAQLLSDKEYPPCSPLHLSGRYALFDGFGSDLQEATALVNQISPGVVKAVHTKSNSSWRFADMCFNIQQEQNAIRRMQGRK